MHGMMGRGVAEAVVGWLFEGAELKYGGCLGGCLEWVMVGGGVESRG
jgi:hypothetical protein